MILRFEAVHDFAPLTNGEIELRRVSNFISLTDPDTELTLI